MFKNLKKKRNQKGFTLVELVVVIAILGILAAIAVPRLTGFKLKAELAADKTTAATLVHAADLYDATEEKGLDEGEITIQKLIDEDLIGDGDYSNFKLEKQGDRFIVFYTESAGEDKTGQIYP